MHYVDSQQMVNCKIKMAAIAFYVGHTRERSQIVGWLYLADTHPFVFSEAYDVSHDVLANNN